MNERIQELGRQAQIWCDQNIPGEFNEITGGYGHHWEEKFAALIIEECMRMCEVTEMSFVTHGCDVEASGAITVKQFIAEHFGVEE